MLTQRTGVAVLFLLSLSTPDCMAVGADKKAFDLCVTSRRRVEDLSYHNLTSVPLNLPNTTEYLDISHNSIQRFAKDAFHRLSQLCFLKATHCGLMEISHCVFTHTPALKVLNISNNELTIIPDFSLQQLTILDLADNVYNSYKLPESFQNLTNLKVLSLGSKTAQSVDLNDFKALMNIPLHHLLLGAGVPWQKYDSGALRKLSLQKISLFASFCKRFDMFRNLLVDLNTTRVKALRFSTLFPNDCRVTDDAFLNLRTMSYVRNLTIENTWINSSFMEMLMKDIWLSSLQDLLFVNITYNEDTPDGFQFHTLNYTVSVRSVTFDGIRHYQYKYPTINTSFEALANLSYLKFSGSGMNILPCKLLSAMPSLETLDVSDNLLKDLGFWWPTCSYTSVFPKLKHLLMSKNRFQDLAFISKKTHQMNSLESLDLSSNSIELKDNCSWPTYLTELNLANNNLGNNIFQYLSPHFERIDLSKSGITALTQEDLCRFPKLTHLLLSSNIIQALPELLHAPALISLHVDQNAITALSKNVLRGLPKLRNLKAGNNPFICSCDLHWFLTALNKSLLLDWPLDYYCSTPTKLAGLPLSEYKTSMISCDTRLQTAVAFSVIIVISTALGLLFYKLDGVWYTKMLWVWIRVKRRGKKHSHILKNMLFSHHAFISYSHRDANFVQSTLVPSLENAGLFLCVHERDFVPGHWIIDNIINCVESSYKTLFVLSKHFVQSEWCNYELFFAQHRAIDIQQDSLVFILLEPIPTDSLPKKYLRLRSLLRRQTYLEWPTDERKQQVFWASLRSMLHVADTSVVLRDVALAISDTATLITN
ncbi:toll-like receptor 1 [Nerophis ophidion]|uniref:toll-like receptor 1 n=1 Tax=Nerophis ophidion TaxID=159077 RepID=UPI002ADF8C9C|nr:toll-like receptor 1 [Nerophis ophidion]